VIGLVIISEPHPEHSQPSGQDRADLIAQGQEDWPH
jgi:hypothetical protein